MRTTELRWAFQCPECCSTDDIIWQALEVHWNNATREASCLCGCEWEVVYKFERVVIRKNQRRNLRVLNERFNAAQERLSYALHEHNAAKTSLEQIRGELSR